MEGRQFVQSTPKTPLLKVKQEYVTYFKKIVIRAVYKKIRLLHLRSALYSVMTTIHHVMVLFVAREGAPVDCLTKKDAWECPHGWWKADTMVDVPAGIVALAALSTTAYMVKSKKQGRPTGQNNRLEGQGRSRNGEGSGSRVASIGVSSVIPRIYKLQL